MIIDEYVEVNVSGRTKQYYIDKGYKIPMYYGKDGKLVVKRSTTIQVKVEDLPSGSGVKIHVACDHCGKTTVKTYKDYLRSCFNGEYVCHNCSFEKHQKTIMERYGVENVSQVPEFKEKARQTLFDHYGVYAPLQNNEIKERCGKTIIEKYGVEHLAQSEEIQKKIRETNKSRYGYEYPAQSPEILEKIKLTNLQRYGCDWVLLSPEIKEKIEKTNLELYNGEHGLQNNEIKEKAKKTNLERYGYEYPTQSPDVREKIKRTNLEKYGVEYVSQNDDIKKKTLETFLNNGSVKTSYQQEYICDLLNGKINWMVSNCFIDIYMDDSKIGIEIDGGGHNLGVKLGNISDREFKIKEMKREMIIRSKGIKIIRIISPHDLYPSDDIILEMYQFAFDFFNNTNHTWIYFYPEDGKYRNAEHNNDNGVDYDFGKLRKISRVQSKKKGVK